MNKAHLRRPFLAALAIAGALVASGAIAYAAIPNAGGPIHGCYQYTTTNGNYGKLRVFDPASPLAGCNSSEKPLDWNQTGPTGQTGATGPAGPPGQAGTSGAAHAYSAFDSQKINAKAPATESFVTLGGLPAGNYLVWGEVGADIDALVCDMVGGGSLLQVIPFHFHVDDIGGTSTHIGRVTLAANGELALKCGTRGDAGKTTAYGRITALRVDSLS